MIQKLPSELLDLIAKRVTAKRDLASLCLASRATKALFTPILYHEIIVEFAPESESSIGKVSKHWTDSENAIANLSYVRHIHFVADIHRFLAGRCGRFDVHNKRGGHPKDIGSSEVCLEDLEPEAILILECIPPGCLLSFSWELATCIPEAVCEYVRNSQPSLENISLITGWGCTVGTASHIFSQSCSLSRLKSLSWIAPSKFDQLLALGRVLRTNASQLEELSLDLIHWSEVQYQFFVGAARSIHKLTSRNFFAEHVLALQRRKRVTLFPNLRALSLTQVSFRQAPAELMWALNLRNLQKLVLRDCVGTGRLLKMFQRGGDLRLEELELVYNMKRDGTTLNQGLTDLGEQLSVMPKLKKLSVMTRQTEEAPETFWKAMQTNASRSLHQLVIHYRNEGTSYLDATIYDSQDKQIHSKALDATAEYLGGAEVERLGFHSDPSGLRHILSHKPGSIKFLHWRLTGVRKRLSDIDEEDAGGNAFSSSGSENDSSEWDNSFGNPESANVSGTNTAFQSSSDNDNTVGLLAGSNLDYTDGELSSDQNDESSTPATPSTNSMSNEEEVVQDDISLTRALVAGLRSEMDDSEIERHEKPPDYILSNNHVITLEHNIEVSPRYLRRSRGFLPIDYANFLAWAFSDDGLPSLQVVVLGDMCHGGRYEASVRIFVRPRESLKHLCVQKGNEAVFYEVRDHEMMFHEIIREHKEMLEACPAEPILRKEGKPPIARPGFHHFPGR